MVRWIPWATFAVSATLLVACGSQRPAPVVDRSGAPSTRAETPAPAGASGTAPARTAREGQYIVQRGDTMYSIAMSFGVDVHDLARWNGIGDASVLATGQTLRVVPPPGGTVTVTPVAPTGSAEVRPLPLPGATPSPAEPGSPQASIPPVPGSPEVARGPEQSSLQWRWPAPGRILENFDETKNKGIDIDGNEGDPIIAAADGEVVYVGSALRGYGNLVIVKHPDDFISAYAHNRRNLVKQGDAVKGGQRIAEFGRSDADRVKLHFEIRRQGKPVDPVQYLPAR